MSATLPTSSPPLRWLVRLILLALFADALWRFAQLFMPGVQSGLSGYLLIGMSVFLCAFLLVGERIGSPEGQARLALQLSAINAFFVVVVALFAIQGSVPLTGLAAHGVRLAICLGLWAFYRRQQPGPA